VTGGRVAAAQVALGRVAAARDAQDLGARAVAGPAVATLPVAETGLGGRLTRRTALAGLAATAAALAVAGCTPKQTTSAAELIAGDALGPSYTETSQLIAAYDRALASAPALVELLGPLREEHRQHLIALASLIGLAMPAVSPGPHPNGIPLPPPHPTASPSAATNPSSTNPTATSPGGTSPQGTSPGGISPGATSPGGTPFTTATPPAVTSGSTPPPPAGSATQSTSPGSPATSTSAPVSPSGSPTAGLSPAVIKAQLSAAEKTAQANAVAVCISVAAERVPIIAAIAACRATHVAALR
ncbi:MAG TPA: hypothetical protein VIR00_04000, partial [Micromonosporaceae bacterium]